jgi:hypothetical protein
VSELSRRITQRVNPSAAFSQPAVDPVLPQRLAAASQFPVPRRRAVGAGVAVVFVLGLLMVIVVAALA